MKFLFFLFSVVLLEGCTSSRVTENRTLLKEYAYCKCFQNASGDTSYFVQDVSLSIYFDIANYNFSAYDKIDSLSRASVIEIKPIEIADYQNKKAIFFNCFNFYKSKQLDSIVKTLDKKITRSW